VRLARKKRAIAVQLTPAMVEKMDRLAAKSEMSRHRYMVLVLERAVESKLVLSEQIAFSDE
jgi:predicted transcriptional regulator